mmetsp:Transcript_12696/g.53408  ORF Transcript_12696/g.53408 Transcript_12696/m.53408 type:complete len:228 (+) Transcript_12696:693-1376(+)
MPRWRPHGKGRRTALAALPNGLLHATTLPPAGRAPTSSSPCSAASSSTRTMCRRLLAESTSVQCLQTARDSHTRALHQTLSTTAAREMVHRHLRLRRCAHDGAVAAMPTTGKRSVIALPRFPARGKRRESSASIERCVILPLVSCSRVITSARPVSPARACAALRWPRANSFGARAPRVPPNATPCERFPAPCAGLPAMLRMACSARTSAGTRWPTDGAHMLSPTTE